jgi:hypothetical protein
MARACQTADDERDTGVGRLQRCVAPKGVIARTRSSYVAVVRWRGADPQGGISVTFLLDSGALITLERNERSMSASLNAAEITRELRLTHCGVVGRGEVGRQARLARALLGAMCVHWIALLGRSR